MQINMSYTDVTLRRTDTTQHAVHVHVGQRDGTNICVQRNSINNTPAHESQTATRRQ